MHFNWIKSKKRGLFAIRGAGGMDVGVGSHHKGWGSCSLLTNPISIGSRLWRGGGLSLTQRGEMAEDITRMLGQILDSSLEVDLNSRFETLEERWQKI